MDVLRVAFLSALVLEMLATVSVAVVAVEIGLRLLRGGLPFAEALFILVLAPEFYQPLRLLGARFHAGTAGTAAADRLFALLDTQTPPTGAANPPPGLPEIRLEEVVKGMTTPRPGVLIGIFMSPLNVHYQRSPIDGVVHDISYHPAPFNHVMGSMFLRNIFRIQPMYAKSPHIVENERNIIHVQGERQDAYVVQIADQQVNKIDSYVDPGDDVAMGQKIGMIRRGSQVDLFLPGLTRSDLPNLLVGDTVRAGTTVPL